MEKEKPVDRKAEKCVGMGEVTCTVGALIHIVLLSLYSFYSVALSLTQSAPSKVI